MCHRLLITHNGLPWEGQAFNRQTAETVSEFSCQGEKGAHIFNTILNYGNLPPITFFKCLVFYFNLKLKPFEKFSNSLLKPFNKKCCFLIIVPARLFFLILPLPKNPNKMNFPWNSSSLPSLSYLALKWLTDAIYGSYSQMKLWMNFKINKKNYFSTQ